MRPADINAYKNLIDETNAYMKSGNILNISKYNVKKVAVIVSPSRSGSTLLKTVLSKHPDIITLDGEEEPYYKLAGNGYPFDDSDGFKELRNKEMILEYMLNEAGLHSEERMSIIDIMHNWLYRLPLQFPSGVSGELPMSEMVDRVEEAYSGYSVDQYTERSIMFLKRFMSSYEAGLYDDSPDKQAFFNKRKFEEPPFIIPRNKRSALPGDFENKTLLLKTPQNAYRLDIFKELFPNADIKFIHLTRGFAQTVNGLMDGWLDDRGFFAHDVSMTGVDLNIDGYSDVAPFGKQWWKFDMPPNWLEFINKPLDEVCLNQWLSANQHILDSDLDTLRVKFEIFMESKESVADVILNYLGISTGLSIDELPKVMTTDKPRAYRWRKRSEVIKKLATRADVINMMNKLNYSMEESTWK